ncbi:MAG: YdeI/OmpD-associated family protein [Alphaproteobacteria bacterium]|nr:YdeI/OmpD-associated family protein [Alphaproteobacteria bacterium]MCB9793616.1 YdeI/OmpD-associated family protein [Alphaproteobacteria bacterium]
MRTTGTVDDWFNEHETWPAEVAALRALVLEAGLDEVLKWGQPTYMGQDHNLLIVSALKAGATISFFRGAVLNDPEGQLVSPGENSRHTRYLIFTSVEEIAARRPYVEALIADALAAVAEDRRPPPLPEQIDYVDELQARLDADEAFREAFEGLTPGRRRAYNIHFSGAKQSSTREDRIERCTERILMGKGFHDCICGHSKRYPRCDGSHKQFE